MYKYFAARTRVFRPICFIGPAGKISSPFDDLVTAVILNEVKNLERKFGP